MLNSPPNCLPCFDYKNTKQTTCATQFLYSTEQPKCSPNVISFTPGSQEQNLFALENYYQPPSQDLVTYSGDQFLQLAPPSTTSFSADPMSFQQQRQIQSSIAAVSLESSQQRLSTPFQTTAMQKSEPFQQRSQPSESVSWEHAQYQNMPLKTTITQESVQYQQQPQQQSSMQSNVQEIIQYQKLHVHSANTVSLQPQQQQITQTQAQLSCTGDNPNRIWQEMEDTPKVQNFPGPKRRFSRRQMIRRRRDPFRAKIFKRTEKRRRNAFLKKLLVPRNAMSILQELCPEIKISVSEVQSGNQLQYATKVEIDGKIFDGSGESQERAKEIGSENALKAILLEKLEQMDRSFETENLKSGVDDDKEMVAVNNDNDNMNINDDKEEGECTSGDQSEIDNKELEDDNASWSALARFAIFKLFAEWKSQGLNEPATSDMIFRTKMSNITKSFPGVIPRKHPVQLLLEIRPNCQFVEKREGSPPNLLFIYSVTADGQTFTGSGRNIKLAKKECAKNALAALGVKYVCL